MRFADILQQYAYGLIQNNTHFIATFGDCHLVYSDNELYELDTENRKWNLSVHMQQPFYFN